MCDAAHPLCSRGPCRAAASMSGCPAAQAHDFTPPRPDLTLRMTPGLLSLLRVLWEPEEDEDPPVLGTGQSSCRPKHDAFLTRLESPTERSCPWDGCVGDARSTPQKVLTVLCGVSMPPPPPPRKQSRCFHGLALVLWGQDCRLVTITQTPWGQGQTRCQDLQRASVALGPPSPALLGPITWKLKHHLPGN